MSSATSADAAPPARTPSSRRRWIVRLVAVLTLLALLVLAVRGCHRAREVAKKRSCNNIMKHLGLALRSYQQQHGALPPSHLTDAAGRPTHSWRTIISPYIFYDLEEDYFAKLDLSKPWNEEPNVSILARHVGTAQCPSLEQPGSQVTHYVAVVGEGTMWPSPVSAASYSPEPSEDAAPRVTAASRPPRLLVVEYSDSDIEWTEPRDLSADEFIAWFQQQREQDSIHPGNTIHYLGDDFEVHELPLSISIDEVRDLLRADTARAAAP